MTPEQKRQQEDQFVRSLIESQQQEEIHQRRERKREEREASNSWKVENQSLRNKSNNRRNDNGKTKERPGL